MRVLFFPLNPKVRIVISLRVSIWYRGLSKIGFTVTYIFLCYLAEVSNLDNNTHAFKVEFEHFGTLQILT